MGLYLFCVFFPPVSALKAQWNVEEYECVVWMEELAKGMVITYIMLRLLISDFVGHLFPVVLVILKI